MRHEQVGDGLPACGAMYGAGLEIRLAFEVEGDLADMWVGREDGFVCAQDGKVPGGQGGGVQ